MRNGMIGGFLGVMGAALILASCGFGGVDFTPVAAGLTQAEVDVQLAVLQQEIDDLSAQLAVQTTALDDHAADTTIHGVGTPTPVLGLNYCISLVGTFPSENTVRKIAGGGTALSADPMLGGIALFAGNFAPRGWAFCEGQLLAISQNTALFSILGTTYGGDGETTFGLPDLRQRAAMHPETPELRLGQERN